MPTAEFDTLTAAQELRASGISDAQAEAIAAAMRKAVKDHAASRTDVAELRAASKADIAELRAASKADIADLRAESRADKAEILAKIDAMEARADAMEARAKADNAALRADLYRALWIQGAGIVAVIGSLMVIAGAFSAR